MSLDQFRFDGVLESIVQIVDWLVLLGLNLWLSVVHTNDKAVVALWLPIKMHLRQINLFFIHSKKCHSA
ncbi:hypothetical protein D3C75_1323970 [compost metagenome]